jgi:hypothetical protein
VINITSSLTPTNCTISGNTCATTGAVASITLAGIPSGHNHLRFEIAGSGSAASVGWISVQLNGDTGSNYDYVASTANNSNANTIRNSNQANAVGYACDLAPNTYWGTGEMRINNYTLTSGYKVIRGVCGADGPTSAFAETGDWTLIWKGTPAAVTSIKFTPQSGNFNSGFTITVYAED